MLKSFLHLSIAFVMSALGTLPAASAIEEGPKIAWEKLRAAYEKGRFEDSLAQLQKNPSNSDRYFYNLGTTYFKLRQTGRAVAYLEKANRLRPHDPDIQNNLTLAKDTLAKEIGPDKLDPASSWIEQLADRISLDEARAILGFLGLCVVLLWLRAYLSARNIRKAIFNPAGWIGVFGFLITVGIYFVQRRADSSPPVICLEAEIIRSGPGDSFLQLSQGEVGSKYRSLGTSTGGQQEEWRQVKYSADGIGWMRASSLLLL